MTQACSPVRKAEHKTGQGCMPNIEQEAPLSPTNRTTHIHRLVQVPSYRPWSVSSSVSKGDVIQAILQQYDFSV